MRRLRPTVAEVDLEAIRHNVRALKPSGSELMAVVKADGYGHGAAEVARAALGAGAAWLGVALVEEGVRLRDSGIEAPILVLSECPPGGERDAVDVGLTPTVYTDRGLAALVEVSSAVGPLAVHVKVDTGMHRVGIWPPEGVSPFVRRLVQAGLRFEGLWTHLASAEDDPDLTREQLRRLREVAGELAGQGLAPKVLHAANSAAAIASPEAHLDLVRIGVALYGLAPAPGLVPAGGLRPALAWRSAVSMARRLPAGEGVSYGHRHRLDRETTIATVPVGYADGFSRRLSGSAEVLIGGRRRPVVGTVTMDHILVDCGEDEVGADAEVVLIGSQGGELITSDELAGWSGTINYEVVTAISPRVPREYRG